MYYSFNMCTKRMFPIKYTLKFYVKSRHLHICLITKYMYMSLLCIFGYHGCIGIPVNCFFQKMYKIN